MSEVPVGFIPDATKPEGFKGDPPAHDQRGVLSGALMDTLGMTNRPGAKTTAQVVLRPEGVGEHAIQAAIMAPTIALGGSGLGAIASKTLPAAVARAAPAVGRVLTSGAIGAGKAAAEGKPMAERGALEAASAAVPEALFGLGGRLAHLFAGGGDAYRKILSVVARGPDGPVNVELVKRMTQSVANARDPVARELATQNAVRQIDAMVPGLGGQFRQFIANFRTYVPGLPLISVGVSPGASRAAGAARNALQNPGVRATADAAGTADADHGVPVGVLAAKGIYETTPLGSLARAILPRLPQ